MMQEDRELSYITTKTPPEEIEELLLQAEEHLDMPHLQNTELREKVREILKKLRQSTQQVLEQVIGAPEDREKAYRETLHDLPKFTKDKTNNALPNNQVSEV